MQESLVLFKTAKLAREKGFDEITYFIFDTYNCAPALKFKIIENFNSLKHSDGDNHFISAPTQSLLQKWLRDVHHINVISWCNASGWAWEIEKTNGTHISIMNIDGNISGTIPDSGMFSSFEEALELGLQEALKLIEL